MKTTEQKTDNAVDALLQLKKLNPLRNDFDAYCYELVCWGLGQLAEKPNPEDFGLKGIEK